MPTSFAAIAGKSDLSHITYPQDWTAYNAAQTHEKDEFVVLLRKLCSGLAELPKAKNGCPRLPIQDAIFCACFKYTAHFRPVAV